MTKGRDTERAAKELYEQVGYEVYQPPKAKYRNQDVFEVFDLLSFGHGRLLGTQVKTNRARDVTGWFEDVEVYAEAIQGLDVEYLVLFEGEGWKLYRPAPDGYQVAFDGREIEVTPCGDLRSILKR